MLFHTIGQGSVFVWMMIAGMLAGLLYDGFDLIRCIFRMGAGMTALLDALWGMVSGVLLAVMLVIANRGQMRAFVLLAVAAGFGLYRAAASRPVMHLARGVGRIVKKLPRFRLLDIVFK